MTLARANSVLGNDLLLSHDGDLQLSPRGDLMTTDDYDKIRSAPFDGYYNLILSIWETLNAVPGEYAFQPEFGEDIGRFIGRNLTPQSMLQLKGLVTDAVERDERVREVTNVKIQYYNNTIVIFVTLLAIGETSQQTLIFPQLIINQ